MQVATERAFFRGARSAVSLGLAGSVLVFGTFTADAFGVLKLAWLWVAGMAAVGCWLLGSAGRGRWLAWGRFATATAVFVGVSAVAMATSVSRADSLFGSYERYGGLLSLVLFAGLAVVMTGVFGEAPEGLRGLVWAVAGSAGVLALYVLLQGLGADFVDWREQSGAPVRFQGGTMGNSDFAGGWLGLAAPFLVYALVRARGRLRWAMASVLLLDVAALAVTRSRGGILALGAGVVVLAVLLRADIPARWRRIGWAVAGLVAVGAVALALVPGLGRASGLEQTELLRTESIEARGRAWAAAVEVFTDRPILGTGPDTFEYRFPRHRSLADARELGLQIADKPHNVLLEKATDTGVLGLAAYLAVLGVVVAMARRRLRDAAGEERLLLAVFTAGLAAYLAQAVVSIDVVPLAAAGWLFLGAVTSLADPAVVARREAAASLSKKQRQAVRGQAGGFTGAVLGAVVAGVLGLLALAPVAADMAAAQAQKGDDRAAAAKHWADASSTVPWQQAYRLGAGFTDEARGAEAENPAERKQFLEAALAHYDKARSLAPESLYAFVGLAKVRTLYAQGVDRQAFEAADQAWRRVLVMDPKDWEPRWSYGLMLNSWANAAEGDAGLRRRAADELERAVALKGGGVDAEMAETLRRVREAAGP